MSESGFTGFRDFQDIPNLEHPLILIQTSATGKDFAQAPVRLSPIAEDQLAPAQENLVSPLDLEVISKT